MTAARAVARPAWRDALPQTDGFSDADFARLSALVSNHTGIRLPPAKRTMMEGRLRKRMRAVGEASLSDYCRFLFERGGLDAEITHVIDAVTTNKTDFFREAEHFDFLTRRIIPDVLSRRSAKQVPLLKLWSAAASNGAEAYTIAMVLADLLGSSGRFRFSILGTDISQDILVQARRAVYPDDFVAPVPAEMQRRYLMRARDRARREVRVVPELRRLVRFAHLNLMDEDYPFDRDIDVIFLRNVLIYFDKPTQVAVVKRLMRHLRPGGYLMLGHAETMVGAQLALRQLAPAIFQMV